MRPDILVADLLKTTGIITATADETLHQVLPQLKRSHDAVFVFDAHDEFLGVIHPYYVLFKKRFPPETKLTHCIFHPPKLSPDEPFWEIARKMRECRIYFLPVFSAKGQTADGGEFLGIVTVRRLFDALAAQKELIAGLSLPVKREVITIHKRASAADAYNALRDHDVSRIVVVDDHGHQVGLVSHYGLQLALNKPREGQSRHSRVGDKKKYLNQPLSKYYKNNVVTAPATVSPEKLFYRMLTEDTSCIVVLDARRVPVGIVSTSDVLAATLVAKMQQSAPSITVQLPDEFVWSADLQQQLHRLIDKLHAKQPIERAQLSVTMSKKTGKRKQYHLKLDLFMHKHKNIFARESGFDWKNAVQAIAAKADRQLRNS